MLGLGLSFARQTAKVFSYVKDSLKAYFRFYDTAPDFLLEGSTDFDSTDDYIHIFDSEAVPSDWQSLSDNITLSAWIRPDSVAGTDGNYWFNHSNIIELRTETSSSTKVPFNFGLEDAKLSLGVATNHTTTAQLVSGTSTLTVDTWYHIAVVIDGDTYQFYLNGKKDGNGTLTVNGDRSVGTTSSNLMIGSRSQDDGASGSGRFDGRIANVGIWSRSVSASEIESIMYRGSYSELKDTELTNLLSWYNLSDESLGSEKVTNGTFDEGITGWSGTAGGNATYDSTNKRLINTPDSGFGTVAQWMTGFVTGERYKVTWTQEEGNGLYFSGGIVWDINGLDYYYPYPTSSDDFTEYFTLTATGNLQTRFVVNGEVGYLDNISVKQVFAPDSHGSNTGTVYGAKRSSDSYSGESPFKPRMQDKATPKMAVQLADGSTDFDGSNDYIAISTTPISDWTFAVWFQTDTIDAAWREIYDQTTTDNDRMTITIYNNQWRLYDTGHRISTYTISDNDWHHYAITQNGTDMKFYVDGSAQGSVTSAGSDLGGSAYIGRYYPSASEYFDGRMANLSIHNVDLTQSQIQKLMFTEKYSGLSADLKTRLISWYDMGSTSLGSNVVSSWANRSAVPYETFTSSGANITDAQNTSASAQAHSEVNLTVGKLYRIKSNLTLNSGTAPFIGFQSAVGGSAGSVNANLLSAGENTIDTTAVANDNFLMYDNNVTTTNFSAETTLQEVLITDAHGTNDGSIYGATVNEGYTHSPHGVVDPLNYGTIYSGTCLHFDGSNDFVDTQESFESTFQNSFSISLWVKPDDGQPSGNQMFFGVYATQANSNEDGIQAYLDSSPAGTIHFNYKSDGDSAGALTANTIFNDGATEWKHLVFIGQSSGLSIYVNGVSQTLDGTIDGSMSGVTMGDFAMSYNLKIGCRTYDDANGVFFDGKINNFKIFSTALTSAQIQELYTNPEQQLPTGVSSSNLKLDYPMQEGAGSYLYDGSLTTGPELIDSQTPDSLSSATYSDGVITGEGSDAGLAQWNVTQLDNNATYTATFSITSITTSDLDFRIRNTSNSTVFSRLNISTTGEHTIQFDTASNNIDRIALTFGSAGDVTGTLSLKKIQIGQNHSAAISGASWATGESGGYQKSLVRSNTPMIFDGSDDKVTVSDVAGIQNIWDGGGSISCWVYPNSDGESDGGRIFEKVQYVLQVHSESAGKVDLQFYIKFTGTDGTWDTSSTEVSINEWSHIVVTYNADSVSNNPIIYVNGSSVTLTESTTPTSAREDDSGDDLYIGNNSGGTRTFDGLINDFSVWETILDADAVTALYNSGTPLLPTSDSGNYDNSGDLQGYWRNDGNATWTDRTPLGVYGSEFLTNGDFSNFSSGQATSWTTTGSPTLSEETTIVQSGSSQKLFMGSSGNNGIDQTVTTVAGKKYQFSAKVYVTGGKARIIFDNGSDDGQTYVGTGGTTDYTDLNTWHTITHIKTAESTSVTARIWTSSANTTVYVDDVSIKRYRGGNDGTASGSPVSIVIPEGSTSGRDSQGFLLTDTTSISNGVRLHGNEAIVVQDSEVLSFGDGSDDKPFSMEVWIKMNKDSSDNFKIANKGIYNSTAEWWLELDGSSKLSFYILDESVSGTYELAYYNTGLASYEEQWLHVCATYDGRGGTSANAGIKLYLDGSSVTTTLGGAGTYVAMENLGANVEIGRYDPPASTSYYAKGLIDEFRIYQKELSASEVLKNYNNGKSAHQ